MPSLPFFPESSLMTFYVVPLPLPLHLTQVEEMKSILFKTNTYINHVAVASWRYALSEILKADKGAICPGLCCWV